MSMTTGRGYLAIPGPSVIPDEVLRAMHRPAPNIYDGELVDMTADVIGDLCNVARTSGNVAIYICNGHGAWEAALANVLEPGDHVLGLATGYFGHGWVDMAQARGVTAETLDFGKSGPVDPNVLEDALRRDSDHRIKAVLATHVDTSTSVRNDIPAIRAAMDAAGHPALLMVDCIASMACDRFEMDSWGVDVAVAASQKGLMVPPGLGFVWFSAKARAARSGLERVSRYWDWDRRAEPALFYHHFGGTAPTHHLYGLHKSLEMINSEGLEAVWARHAHLARAIWAACEVWGAGEGELRLNIADPAHRSHAVTSLSLASPNAARLRSWTESEGGVTLGIGLGMAEPGSDAEGGYFRIGHMGHVNAQMILGVLGTIEAGMGALSIPHGPGGISAAAQVIAQS